jgi:hypothetical protein
MDRTCNTHGRYGKCIQNFILKTEVIDHFENIGVDGRIILRWILRNQDDRGRRLGSSGGVL